MIDTVLFLDVDGVLNAKNFFPAPGMKPPWIVDLNKVQALNHVLRQMPNVRIVVSSTWRLPVTTPTVEDFCAKSLVERELIHDDWRTIQERGTGIRFTEIHEWLCRHPEITRYCVVDDGGDACVDPKCFVQTDGELGMTYEQLELICKRLGYNLQGQFKVQRRRQRK